MSTSRLGTIPTAVGVSDRTLPTADPSVGLLGLPLVGLLLRYLKMGGRVFLVVGVVVDGIQMAGAVQQSFEQKSVKPAAAQAVRTGGSWLAAWGGAKAGMRQAPWRALKPAPAW